MGHLERRRSRGTRVRHPNVMPKLTTKVAITIAVRNLNSLGNRTNPDHVVRNTVGVGP